MAGVLCDFGALWVISQDGSDQWRVRAPRVAGTAVSAGLGITLGALLDAHVNSTALAVAALAIVALGAGLFEASGWGGVGMYLALGTVVGSGLGLGGAPWRSGGEVLLGGAWVVALAALSDWRSRRGDYARAIADGFDALVRVGRAVGTERFDRLNRQAVAIIDTAQDALATTTRASQLDTLQCFVVLLQVAEYTAYLQHRQRHAERDDLDALREIAHSLRYRGARATVKLLSRYAQGNAVSPALSAALTPSNPERLLRANEIRSSASKLPWGERFRFAGLLALVASVAQLLATALHGPHGFWLPMTVVFLFRPDVGPVLHRATARIAGTFVGVLIAVAVSYLGHTQISLVLLSVVMAAAVPWAQQRSYTLTVMIFTPIVFVFVGLVHPTEHLFGARILDTLLAASLVLLLDRVLWVRSPSMRPAHQFLRTEHVVREYLATTLTEEPIRRHTMRRKALRAVNRTRQAVEETRRERRRSLAHVEITPQLDSFEHDIRAHATALFEEFAQGSLD